MLHSDSKQGNNIAYANVGQKKRLFVQFALIAAALVFLLTFKPTNTTSAANDNEKQDVRLSTHILSAPLPTKQIIIKYKASADLRGSRAPNGSDRMQTLSDVAGVQLTYFREMSGKAHVLRLPEHLPYDQVESIAKRLMTLADVEYAEPDAIMQHTQVPNDPLYSSQWHYFETYGINAPAAWDITTGASNIVVAVIDTGITNHADLSGQTVPGYDFISNSWVANDGDGRDNNPSDPGDWNVANECGSGSPAQNSSWHGTHVAGTIGARSNNSVGVAGVNWSSKILPVRVLGKCGGLLSDIVDGMYWAAGLSVSGVPNNPYPAKVLNLSLGGLGTCGTTYQAAINAITATGATVVVAAGNNNLDASNVMPANCNGVITVAATNRSGNKANYSNYGSLVEISAPGGETNINSSNGVLSTLNTGTTIPVADTYAYYQGTSMAAPHVAGVALLLYSLSPNLTPTQVQQILQNTATPFPLGSTCNTLICGTGIVNAGSAVAVLPRITSLSPSSVPAGNGDFTLTVYGANFVSGSTVRWNGLNRPTTFINSGELRASISAADVALPTIAQITVVGTHSTYGSLTTAGRTFIVTGTGEGASVYLPFVVKGGGVSPTPTPTTPPSGWQTIVNTDFEGAWPSPWTIIDNDGITNGEYYWGKRTCRAFAGSYSGWGVGAGASGNSLTCGSHYPNNANSWMVYGPFSLVGATAAELRFKLWLNTELNYDYVCRAASIDGANFYGSCTSGNSGGWIDRTLDLTSIPTLGNLLGRSNVWVALQFYSDSSITYSEGGYVDNIILRKCPTGGYCPPGGTAPLSAHSNVFERPMQMTLSK